MVARSPIISVVVAMSVCGCSGQQDEPSAVSTVAATPRRPVISLVVEPPADPTAVNAGSPLNIICKITVESGGFEPSLVVFQVADSKNKSKVIESYTVGERKSSDHSVTFTCHTKAPRTQGRFAIDAKVIGVDTTLRASGPEQAPLANGTKATPGARGEFSAPSLEIEVK